MLLFGLGYLEFTETRLKIDVKEVLKSVFSDWPQRFSSHVKIMLTDIDELEHQLGNPSVCGNRETLHQDLVQSLSEARNKHRKPRGPEQTWIPRLRHQNTQKGFSFCLNSKRETRLRGRWFD